MNINIDYKELKDYELYTKDYGDRIYEILQDRTDEYLKDNRKSKTVILNLRLMKEYNMDMAVYGLLLSMAKKLNVDKKQIANSVNKLKKLKLIYSKNKGKDRELWINIFFRSDDIQFISITGELEMN